MIRIYSVIPSSALLQSNIEHIFFISTFCKDGIRGKRRIRVSPCDCYTLSLYKNVIIWQEENTFYIKRNELNNNSHQMILSFNDKNSYEKVYIGNVEEVAILFKEDAVVEKFINVKSFNASYTFNANFFQNTDTILNTLFNIKGYKNRSPFIQAVLCDQFLYNMNKNSDKTLIAAQ